MVRGINAEMGFVSLDGGEQLARLLADGGGHLWRF
jgi:hypothetical protein